MGQKRKTKASERGRGGVVRKRGSQANREQAKRREVTSGHRAQRERGRGGDEGVGGEGRKGGKEGRREGSVRPLWLQSHSLQ